MNDFLKIPLNIDRLRAALKLIRDNPNGDEGLEILARDIEAEINRRLENERKAFYANERE